MKFGVTILFSFAFAALTLITDPSAADVVFETDEDVLVVRIRDQYGFVVVEVIAPGYDMVNCILVDDAGEPIAIAQGIIQAGAGQAMAEAVDVSTVASASCSGSNF